MSISTEITRLQTLRNRLRTKLVALGLAQSNAVMSDCVTAVEGIVNQGSVSATVQEGESYTIPAGYHDGTGTVAGVSGGGNYNLQTKTVTPTKSQQSITSDSGFYGLSGVTVEAIPVNYQDVSSVDAVAADVLSPKIIVDAEGRQTPGTMPNNGSVAATIDGLTKMSYTIPKGYHDGKGTVALTPDIENALAAI